MNELHVSIGEVKRDISHLVNRVAYGGERVVLTSRGKPKAVIVSIEDYEHLVQDVAARNQSKQEAWLVESDRLVARIADRLHGAQVDTETILAAEKADQEALHDYLRGD